MVLFWIGNALVGSLLWTVGRPYIRWPHFGPAAGLELPLCCAFWFSLLACVLLPLSKARGWARTGLVALLVAAALAATSITLYKERAGGMFDAAMLAWLTCAGTPWISLPILVWGVWWSGRCLPQPAGGPDSERTRGLNPQREDG